MAGYRKISDAEKIAVTSAVQGYLKQGWTWRSAYNQVKVEYEQDGKKMPTLNSVFRWTKPAALQAAAESVKDIGPEEQDDDTAGRSRKPDDYTRRLELVVRLYRTRTEETVDAVCDELLPELIEEEN